MAISPPSERGPAAPLLLSDIDTARQLGIGKTKARELIKNGELRSVRIGRRLLVPADSIAEYVAQLDGRSA